MQEADDVRRRLEDEEKRLLELEEKLNAREKVSTFICLMWLYPAHIDY